MLNENKNESYICQTTLKPNPINPVVIENMTDVKQSESCDNEDTTVKCDNNAKYIRTESENVANTTTTNQKRASLKKILNDALYDKVKSRTQEIRSARWAIADAGATGHFDMAGARSPM